MNFSAPSVPSLMNLSPLLALDSATRLYDVEIDGIESIATPLQLEAFNGNEALSALFHFDLLLLSTDANISLGKLIGQQARLITRLADGSDFARSGYISRAERLGADGSLARYRIRLVPWLWLATQRSDCRVFQEKTVLEIIESVFAAYAPRMRWALAEGVEAFMADAPVRSYCVQYRESDYVFVTRLLSEEGLGFSFVEQDDAELGDAPCHSLLIFSSNDALPEDTMSSHALGGTGIRFHKAGSQESQDAVTAFGAERILQAAVSSAVSWDYKTKGSIAVSVPTNQDFGGANAPELEQYDVPGAYAFTDNTAAERYVRLAREAIEARSKQFAGSGSVRSFRAGHRFVLTGSPLDREALLRGEQLAASAANASRHFVLLGVQHAGINNLPKGVMETASSLGDAASALASSGADATLLTEAGKRGYANHFTAQRVQVPWRPALTDETGVRLNPRPTVSGVQSAIVVGAQGETTAGTAGQIHTDALHRVRVQFHWQRDRAQDDTAPHTAWLRMASRYAGAGLGAQFVPRIGQEVLVGFMEGDIDRPVVLGSLYNGQGDGGIAPRRGGDAASGSTAAEANSPFAQAADHRPSAQGNLRRGMSPAWHGEASAHGAHRNAGALSGFKSAEYGNGSATAFSQLVFDDTDGQQRVQLATTQAAAQLNLGHLVHQADNYRGSHRGDGFELRTDAYGALRAARGALFTTWPIQAAIDQGKSEPTGDATAALALWKQTAALLQNTSQIATTHKTVAVAASAGSTASGQSALDATQAPLPAQQRAANGMLATTFDAALSDAGSKATAPAPDKIPHSADALLTFAARGGLGVVAGQSLQWAAGETLTWASGQDTNFALASKLRIHTGQALGILAGATGAGHLKAIAATGPVVVQAQADTMTLASKEQLKMVSVSGKLDVASAKKIHLAVAGGSAITIEGGNITVQCPGVMTVHAGNKSFAGGGKVSIGLPVMPTSTITPEPQRQLESTFALDQLTRFAQNATKAEFIALVVPVFGFDIPANTYLKLYEALRSGTIANPKIVLMSGGPYPAAFDNETREICVHKTAVERTLKDNAEAWELVTVLLHEFGHYIDAVLRQDLTDKDADGRATLAPDAPRDEGAKFAYAIANFDLASGSNAVFAQYTSPDYTGPLKVNYSAARKAIQLAQGEEAQRKEGKSGSLEHFGAGRGEHAKENPESSFGHASIEDGLITAAEMFKGFKGDEIRKQVYFGNWLRDFSQVLDPKIVRPPNLPKDLGRYLSREALTQLVALKAEIEFGEKPADRKLFKVTPQILGVYRPVEHIDNPTNNDPKAVDPRTVDPDFDPLPTPESLQVDPATSMKRYIASSCAYMRSQLNKAAALGRTREGYREFGAGLHVLEDYFAHSNFVELSLRKVGHVNVLPWTSKAPGKHPYPLVTGMFDSEDVIASTAGMIADTLFKVKWEFQATEPGERTPSDRAMLILLDEHSDPAYLKRFRQYLWLRDKIASVPGHQYPEALMHYTVGMVANLHNFVFNSLLHLLGNSVGDEQVYTAGDPNTNGSTNPTHSQLAKDHDNHPFHTLAASLAKEAVSTVGRAMAARWQGDVSADPGAVAAGFLAHPFDSTWQDQAVATWAKGHAKQVKRGESSTEWIALRKEHEKEVRDSIRQAGQKSQATWDYINKNYDMIFGEKNQVKK